MDLSATTELLVGGDKTAPDPLRFALAERVVDRLETVITEAKRYLGLFVDFKHLESKGEWDVLAVEIGRSLDEPLDEFSVLFELDNDTYGLWAVRFREGSSGVSPFLFSRKQC